MAIGEETVVNIRGGRGVAAGEECFMLHRALGVVGATLGDGRRVLGGECAVMHVRGGCIMA